MKEPNYAQVVEIDGEVYVSERMATAVLRVTRQSLFNWRKEERISGVTWRALSRSGKVKNLRGQKAPRPSWIFYSKSEIGRILAERGRRSPLPLSPDGEPERPKGDASREIAELFAESQQLPAKRKGEDRHVVLDETDPDG